MASTRPVLANAMWRTGSTFLASRFAASPAYMMFYEPDHELVGRLLPILLFARHWYRPSFTKLNHPELGTTYFGTYHTFDPRTHLPLPLFHPRSAALRDVYNQASGRMISLLRACERVARKHGLTPFFGFCRSGTQHERIDAAIDADVLHLWRDPREQFASYDWPNNDYFIPGTLAQLLFSRDLRDVTIDLLAPARLAEGLLTLSLVEKAGVRNTLRFARRLARPLDPAQAYTLFYVAWLTSMTSGGATASESFSINQLIESASLRDRLRDRFGITLDGARPTTRAVPLGLDYPAIERRVEQALAALPGRVAMADRREAGARRSGA